MFKWFLFSFCALLLSSCDVFVSLPYHAENKTSEPVRVFVPHYQGSSVFGRGVDTILEMQAYGKLFLGTTLPRVTGPVRATKRIYDRTPGLCGLKLIRTDTTLIGCSRKEWKFRRGVSVLRIRR